MRLKQNITKMKVENDGVFTFKCHVVTKTQGWTLSLPPVSSQKGFQHQDELGQAQREPFCKYLKLPFSQRLEAKVGTNQTLSLC